MPHLPIGTHLVRVKSTALGTTSTGKTQIAVAFENEHGHATWYGYFTPASVPYTLERLNNCGWNSAEHNHDVASLHESQLLVGNEVEIVIEEEMDNEGRARLKVAWVNRPGEGGGLRNKLSAEEARRVGADLRALIVTAKGPSADVSHDDIPF